MGRKPRDVLTIEEVSSYLRIPKSTLYKLAQERRLPCQKVGRHWRFHKATLDQWLAATAAGPAEEGYRFQGA